MNFNEWVNKIYDEEDFGRSIATTVSGVVGLAVYLQSKDWVLSVFVTVIVFPLLRLLASAAHTRWKKTRRQKLQVEEAQRSFQRFSPEEKAVLRAFVGAGGAVLTYSQINRANVSVSAVESLVHRGILTNSITSDGMSEAFIMETDVFDTAQQAFSSSALSPTSDCEEIPF